MLQKGDWENFREGLPGFRLDIEIHDVLRSGLDESPARRNIFSHEHFKDVISFLGIFDLHFEHLPDRWIHGGLPELVRIHLSETLVSLDSFRRHFVFIDDRLLLLIRIDIPDLLSFRQTIEWRLGDVDVTVRNKLPHVSVEEGEQQCPDVGSVDVGIGHDYDPVVSELRELEGVSDGGSEGDDEILYLLIHEDFIQSGLFGIQDLSPEWQYRLEFPIASLLRASSCGISLYDIELGFGRIPAGAVGQLSREGHPFQDSFPDDRVPSAAGRYPCPCRNQALLDHELGILRILLEEFVELLSYELVGDSSHLRVPELRFGLSFELRFRHLYADDGRDSFHHIFIREILILLLQNLIGPRILVDRTGECGPESDKMGSSFGSVDVIHE